MCFERKLDGLLFVCEHGMNITDRRKPTSSIKYLNKQVF